MAPSRISNPLSPGGSAEKPVIIGVAFPASGHTGGPLQVASHLAKNGCKVYFITSPEFKKSAHESIDFVENPWDLDPSYFERRLQVAEIPQRMVFDLKHIFADTIPKHFQLLKETLERARHENPGRPIVILQETMYMGLLPFLFGAPLPEGFNELPPVINFATTNNFALDDEIPPFGFELPYDPTPENLALWKSLRETMRPMFDELNDYHNGVLEKLGATGGMSGSYWNRMIDTGRITLFPTSPSTEYPRKGAQAKRYHFIGGLPLKPVPSGFAYPVWWSTITDNAELPTEQRKKVVLVTQGTVSPNWEEIILPTIRALAGRSDTLVIATLGARGASLVEGQLGIPVPDNTFVIDYLPYDLALPYTDVFFTNAGYNGFMHGVMNGVPMLIAGKDADKGEVALRAEYCGIAVNLATGTPTETQIRSGVQQILDDNKYKKRALELKKENEEMDSLRQVEVVIEQILAGKI